MKNIRRELRDGERLQEGEMVRGVEGVELLMKKASKKTGVGKMDTNAMVR